MIGVLRRNAATCRVTPATCRLRTASEGPGSSFANASAADGTDTNFRAFYWRKGESTRPLPALPDHLTTVANSINDRGRIVGQSCDASFACKAVTWRDCQVVDLNAVLDSATTLILTTATDIDDRGRITGQAFDTASNQFVAFVATPVRR